MRKSPDSPKKAQKRGAGEVQRSQSGGAVKGSIPNKGGSNEADFEAGIGKTVAMKEKKAKGNDKVANMRAMQQAKRGK